MEKYDLIYVGCGPSTIWSLLHLVKNNYKGKVLVIEQGKDIENRPKTDIQRGYAGAGCFSDFKISFDPTVGGSLAKKIPEADFEYYGNLVLKYLNDFLDEKREWVKGKEYPCKNSDIIFVTSKVCHLGTDNGFNWGIKTEKYLKEKFEIHFEEQVIDINPIKKINLEDNCYYEVITDKGKYKTEKLVLATGPNDKLTKPLSEKMNLLSLPDHLQMGIRVESSNEDGRWTDILAHNYDFKFRKTYEYGNVRTFCCNSYAAFIAQETNNGAFISYNGHAYKDKEKFNNKVNFGVMCESELDLDKDEQISICKNINSKLPDSPYKILDISKLRSTKMPKVVVDYIIDFVKDLNKIVKIDDAVFYVPEIKLVNKRIRADKFGKIANNLYLIGDVITSRGILQSAATGLILADNILGNRS